MTQQALSITDPLSGSGPLGNHRYTPEFERLWRHYPQRKGGNPKVAAWRAYCRRIRAGFKHEQIEQGVKRYAAYCDAEGKTGTPYVMRGSTFLGPDEHFLEAYEFTPAEQQIPKDDNKLVAWGEARGMPPKKGETFYQYRNRLQASLP